MVLWLLYFSTQWNKGLKLKIPLFKWKQLLPGADRNLFSKLTAQGCILPLTQPLTAHQGAGSSVHGLRGSLFFGCLLWFLSLLLFFFFLWHEGMDSIKKEVSNLLHGKGCLRSTALQCITLADPCQHPAFLGRCWLTVCFPFQCSEHSWPSKGIGISNRSPPRAPKTKNKCKPLVTL